MSGTILVVDDVATNRIALKARLANACYDTHQARTGEEALERARCLKPDLILLDMTLPDVAGDKVCRSLKADPATASSRVLAILPDADRRARCAALRCGADDFVVRPVDEGLLLARLRSLLRERELEEELRGRVDFAAGPGLADAAMPFVDAGRLCIVAQSRSRAMMWRLALAAHLDCAMEILSPRGVLNDGAGVPDAYLIESQLASSGDGLLLLSELRARSATRHAGVCVVLTRGDRRSAAMALDLGANGILEPAFDPEEASLRIAAVVERKQRNDMLRARLRDGLRLALTDPLTGAHNRRYAMPKLDEIAARARETGQRFAVMLLDVDRLKTINDTHGHAAGDAVLCEVAARLRRSLRPMDMLARIGGDEFLVAMPDITLGAARLAAERLRYVVERAAVRLPGRAGTIAVTLSVGLAATELPLSTAPDGGASALQRADRALLAAKSAGRNQVGTSDRAA